MRPDALEIVRDDLAHPAVRALLRTHLEGMRAASPPGHSFALDLSGLRTPDVTVWTAWIEGELAGVGALKTHNAALGEVKSMRTDPAHLRRGVGRALLDHVIAEPKAAGLIQLSLETGRGPAFAPALALYRRRGFVDGGPFADYEDAGFSQFMHLAL